MKIKVVVKNKSSHSGFNKGRPKNLILYIAVFAVCCLMFIPSFQPLLERAAVISAAVTMPEGALQLIRDRFSADIEEMMPEPVENSSSSQQEPQSSSSEPPKESSSSSSSQSGSLPEIEQKYKGTILEEKFYGSSSSGCLSFNNAWLKNYTKLNESRIMTELKKPLELKLPKTDQPKVLIIHTHATESFELFESPSYDMRNSWRTTDNNKNMVKIGDVLAKELEAAGIKVIHDDTQHDYPSYNGSYERSAVTIKNYLKKYPSIKVIFDVHRDAIERDGNVLVAPTAVIDGKKCAQVMVIAGCDNGKMNMPKWSSNLRFAAHLTSKMEGKYPGLTRPVLFDYRKYNYNLSSGLLLIEFGAGGNSLDEVIYSAELAGKATAELLLELQQK